MEISNSFEFKKSYTCIFSLNYLVQGLNHSMFVIIIPIYLLVSKGIIDASAISFMISFIMIPFTLKVLFGVLSDKIGTEKLGRRKFWILLSSFLSGSLWLFLPLIIFLTNFELILIFAVIGVIIILGIVISDSAIDGFILDICPQSQLGQTTGFCWALREVGIILGAPISLLILIVFPIETIFIIIGILTIFFSLLTVFIKEKNKSIFHNTKIYKNLRIIVKNQENWKVFGFSFFMTIIGGIIYVFLSLFILIKIGLVNPNGAKIELLNGDISLYYAQAIITTFISIGVVVGSIFGGLIADKKSRRIAVFLSFVLTWSSLSLLLIPIPSNYWYFLLIFAGMIGFSVGCNASALTSIISEYSKKYPETNLTYLSICLSFTNLGTIFGLLLTGIIFNTFSYQFSNITLLYGIIFLSMASIYIIGSLTTLIFMDKKQYEYKYNIKKSLI